MNYSEQILRARFEQLPKGVREAIVATPWEDKLAQIASKHRLHIDQADRLGKETIIVMFGLDHPDNLAYNIAKHLEVSEEKALEIANDLNREIFLKVRESLKQVIEGKEESRGNLLDKEEVENGRLLGKKKEEEIKTETEEMPSREDLLKEIEDKEHHNLPMVNKSELHLGVQLPSEVKVFEKPTNLSSKRASFEETTSDIKAEEKQVETSAFINQDESEQEREIFEKINRNPHSETELSNKKDVVEGSDFASLLKARRSDVGKKEDPYREEVR